MSEVEECLDAIVANVKPPSNFETKFSAVETVRKIFKSVLMANGMVGHEVRKDAWGWEDRMVGLLGMFTEEELVKLCHWEMPGENGTVTWVEKLEELKRLADGYGIFEGLGEALEYLEGEGDEEEGEDEEGEEEEEGDDEGGVEGW
ncbi:hypothetical protein B0T21DRAFT_393525 [Apiosordaria backusii]|uniref:Uncharacterized protein n=1 Tax=Apiosordaria backusii TaxID=314023 RepID=A0AA40EH51_9PEZI|nr:hypothetical protein B0T21DRAFT_393525 [Apiosordaria backusii]